MVNSSYIIANLVTFCTGASALFNRFNEGQWNVHINDLNCTGNEGTIWDCPHNSLDNYTCNHYDDAAVVCQCKYLLNEFIFCHYISIKTL